MDHKLNSEIISEIDSLINDFKMEGAKKRLDKIDHSTLPEKDRAPFASLARRSGNYKLALKILQPNIYGVGTPKYDDLIEYASSVRRLGLINQALILLERAPDLPKTHLNRAFCYIHYWDYEKAQVELIAFLKSPELSKKQQLVGKVNLLTCLVENKEYVRALNFLDDFEAECAEESPHLLLNCEETRGQILFKMGKYEEALKVLEAVKVQTHEEQGQASLFIEKWLILTKIALGILLPISPEVLEFKKQVRREGFWEVMRDFNWQQARLTNNTTLMRHVFFGTPYNCFREHILNDANPLVFEESFNWMDSRSSEETTEIFNFFEVSKIPMAYGKSVHRLLMLLASDFYQPWSVVRIFNHLFPEELFDPTTSLKKVYRLIEQLQKIINKENIKLSLESTSNGYRLRPKPGCVFLINKNMIFKDRESLLAEALRFYGVTENFKVADAKKVIPLSQHQWYRAFKSMEDLGLMEQSQESQSHFSLKKVS